MNAVRLNSLRRHLCTSKAIRARSLNAFAKRNASSLVIVEHDNKAVSSGSLAAVTAASQLGGEVKSRF